MFCDKCGTEIADDAVFCSKCGHQVGTPVDESHAAQPPQNTRSRKTLWMIVAAVALLIVAGVVAGSIVMAQNRAAAADAAKREAQAEELRDVYESVAAVDSATAVGINFQSYSAKVQEAQAAVDAYRAPDAETEAIVADLEDALDSYIGANSYWNDCIQSTYREATSEDLSVYWQAAGLSLESAREQLEAYETD